MQEAVASRWAQDFEGKSETELDAMRPPYRLPTLYVLQWQKERDAAKAALAAERRKIADLVAARADHLAQPAPAAPATADEITQNVREWPENRNPEEFDENGVHVPEAESERRRVEAAQARRAQAAAARETFLASQAKATRDIALPQPLVIPNGRSDELLERQIASCSGLIDYLATYIARNDTDADVCANFMDRITALMKSSAGAGKVVGRLRGLGPEETCHRMIVQHEGGKGEGVLRQ